MAKNNFAKAVNNVLKQSHANATRCCMVWAALALREEGYGRDRLKRVLDNILKYACALNSKVSINEQLEHIEKITGLRIVWGDDDEIRIEDCEEWDDEEG